MAARLLAAAQRAWEPGTLSVRPISTVTRCVGREACGAVAGRPWPPLPARAQDSQVAAEHTHPLHPPGADRQLPCALGVGVEPGRPRAEGRWTGTPQDASCVMPSPCSPAAELTPPDSGAVVECGGETGSLWWSGAHTDAQGEAAGAGHLGTRPAVGVTVEREAWLDSVDRAGPLLVVGKVMYEFPDQPLSQPRTPWWN